MIQHKQSASQTVRFLEWIRRYSGWWYLICTPDEKHMTLDMMKMLVTRLHQEGFYEIIFVLLMVHRNAPFMAQFSSYLLLDSLIAQWETRREDIIGAILQHLE